MAGTVLKRKIDIAAERKAKASLQNSLVQDIEHATAKVFLNVLHTEITAVVVGSEIGTHVDTIGNMRGALFGILEIGEDVGLAGFDDAFIDTAVSILTGAKPGADKAKQEPSKTDAALTKMLINTILTEIFHCTDIGENTPARSVQMSEYETDKAPLVFLLHKRRYALLSVSVAGPAGEKFGLFELVLPLSCIEKFAVEDAANNVQHITTSWAENMEAVAISAPLSMTAIVDKLQINLGEILQLEVGQVLDLSNGSLTDLTLVAETEFGSKTIFTGQLGALNANKAFKITQTTDQIYHEPVEEMHSVA